jgi:hypothetical protein
MYHVAVERIHRIIEDLEFGNLVAREEQTLRVKYGQWRCAAISAEKGRRTR